jgi:hypothetical protein
MTIKDDDVLTAIYVIAADDEGPVKIGVSRKPWHRLAELQTAHPEKLGMCGIYYLATRDIALKIEAWLLDKVFKEDRLEGEWIAIAPSSLTGTLHRFIEAASGDYYRGSEFDDIEKEQERLRIAAGKVEASGLCQ